MSISYQEGLLTVMNLVGLLRLATSFLNFCSVISLLDRDEVLD